MIAGVEEAASAIGSAYVMTYRPARLLVSAGAEEY
jgi:hypothetical protein